MHEKPVFTTSTFIFYFVFKTKWHDKARRMNCEERNGRVYPSSTPALFCGSFLCLIERCFDNRFSRMRGRKQFSRLADRFQIALFAVEIFHLDCYAEETERKLHEATRKILMRRHKEKLLTGSSD